MSDDNSAMADGSAFDRYFLISKIVANNNFEDIMAMTVIILACALQEITNTRDNIEILDEVFEKLKEDVIELYKDEDVRQIFNL